MHQPAATYWAGITNSTAFGFMVDPASQLIYPFERGCDKQVLRRIGGNESFRPLPIWHAARMAAAGKAADWLTD